MKLSRRGKHARRTMHTRRGKYTKHAVNHLRYKSKKFRASKIYTRGRGGGRVRTHKRGKRFQKGGNECETIAKVGEWISAPDNSYIANIPSVNLKYQKKKFWSTIAYSNFNVVLKISNNGKINIQFIRLDKNNIIHPISHLDMLSSPGLSDWTNMMGVKYSFNFPNNKNVFDCIIQAITKKKNEITDAAAAAAADAAAAATISKQNKIESQNKEIESGNLTVDIGDDAKNYVKFKSDLEKMASIVKDEDATPQKTQKVDKMVTDILSKQLNIMIQCNVKNCRTFPPKEDLEEIETLVEQLKRLAPKFCTQEILAQKTHMENLQLTPSTHDLPPYLQTQVDFSFKDKYLTNADGSLILDNQGRPQIVSPPPGTSSAKELAELPPNP